MPINAECGLWNAELNVRRRNSALRTPNSARERGAFSYEYVALIIMIAAGAMGVYLFSDHDVRLCRQVLAQLVNGNLAVGRAIDWAHLQALDVDVGAAYAALPNRPEQLNYERAFIRNFAEGFRKSGGRLGAFTHWRAEPDGTVSADYSAKQKTLVFRLSGRRQVDGITWKAPK